MKNYYQIEINVANKRYRRKVKSARKKKKRRLRTHLNRTEVNRDLKGDFSYANIIKKLMPPNVAYLISCEKSIFHIDKLSKIEHNGIFKVPSNFSIVENPNESYKFIANVLSALLFQKQSTVNIDYGECENADLSAQVVLDIILKDIIKFYNKCIYSKDTRLKMNEINGINIKNNNVRKLLFSVGSPAIFSNKAINFSDIIPYKLCIHDRSKDLDTAKTSEQKDLDTTTLVDYVVSSLKTLNRKLTQDRLEDLSTVVGEILINAEEHSSTNFRFSIGYFHEFQSDAENDKHYGVFRLAILNFGQTIYEKFKDPQCPNKQIVLKMQDLSKQYTSKGYFWRSKLEEETLWTLYALQDGVTSVDPLRYRKRGNGSIQFIESFFNIKGDAGVEDDFSKMSILSGNTSIVFDGKYKITNGLVDGEPYKFMTFNKSGSIEDKPDENSVKFVQNYFPGTIISAKILFNEDDLTVEDYDTK